MSFKSNSIKNDSPQLSKSSLQKSMRFKSNLIKKTKKNEMIHLSYQNQYKSKWDSKQIQSKLIHLNYQNHCESKWDSNRIQSKMIHLNYQNHYENKWDSNRIQPKMIHLYWRWTNTSLSWGDRSSCSVYSFQSAISIRPSHIFSPIESHRENFSNFLEKIEISNQRNQTRLANKEKYWFI